MIAAVIMVANTVPADAAVLRYSLPVIKHIGTLAKKTSDGIWKNKGSIAVGTAAAVVLTNPEAATAAITGTTDIITEVVAGTTEIVTDGVSRKSRQSTGGSIIPTLLFYLLITVLVIAGVRYCLQSIGLRKILPLLVLGILLFCGNIAEAGMIDYASFPEIECGKVKLPWWNIVTVVLLVISLIVGG